MSNQPDRGSAPTPGSLCPGGHDRCYVDIEFPEGAGIVANGIGKSISIRGPESWEPMWKHEEHQRLARLGRGRHHTGHLFITDADEATLRSEGLSVYPFAVQSGHGFVMGPSGWWYVGIERVREWSGR